MTNDKCQMNVKIIKIIKEAIREDVGAGDITTNMLIPEKQQAKAVIIAKESGIIAGLEIAREVFRQIDPTLKLKTTVKDGAEVKKGKIIAELSGPARGILAGERVALNFLQHLSGIATLTRKFAARVKGQEPRIKILDTRKTIPGLRALEKYAVKVGGGKNHRMGLYDAVLIKDNHIALVGGVKPAVIKAKEQAKAQVRRKEKVGIEVEAKNIYEVKAAIVAGAERILLDNMKPKILREAVALCRKAGIKTEASGGVNLTNVAAIAATGVDYISVGALTHSAPALDISLNIL